jgi:hypothetical protein
MKKLIAFCLVVAVATAGCATTPANPVPVAQVGDETKPCDAIVNEMQQMISAQQMAAGDKNTQIGSNVALGVSGFFLLGIPWFFMDLGGAATVEQKAAQARFQRLQQMAIDRKCTNVPMMKPETTAESDPSSSNKLSQAETTVSKSLSPVPVNPMAQPGAGQPKEAPLSPAKRIEELNSLRQRGLITQQEFDTKRAEIIKSL